MIRFFVMDVDGTLTDGKVYIGQEGELFKAFDIKDGYGISHILPEHNIIPVVITARESRIVENRCKELNVGQLYQGKMNKWEVLQQILNAESLKDGQQYSLRDVAYIGDDVLDLQCMKPIKDAGGMVCCPKNAVPQVRDLADYISQFNGGDGAVRDAIEWIINR